MKTVRYSEFGTDYELHFDVWDRKVEPQRWYQNGLQIDLPLDVQDELVSRAYEAMRGDFVDADDDAGDRRLGV